MKKPSKALEATVRMVRTILEANNEIQPETAEAALDVIVGKRKACALKAPETVERPMSITEVCAALGKSAPTVTRYARLGLIKTVIADNRCRNIGYDPQSVRDLANGKAAKRKGVK